MALEVDRDPAFRDAITCELGQVRAKLGELHTRVAALEDWQLVLGV